MHPKQKKEKTNNIDAAAYCILTTHTNSISHSQIYLPMGMFFFLLVRCTYTFVHLVLLCITEFSYMNDVDSYFDALSLAFTIHLDRYTIQWPFLGVCLCVCVHLLIYYISNSVGCAILDLAHTTGYKII